MYYTLCACVCVCTVHGVDYSLNMVDGPIPIQVHVGGVIRGQGNTAQRSTLIQVQYIHTLTQGEGGEVREI